MEQFTNDAQGTLSGALTDVAVSLTVADGSTFPASGDFRIRIDNEIILVGARAGNTFSSLTRGAEGTVASSHAAGVLVEHVITAASLVSAVTDRLQVVKLQTVELSADGNFDFQNIPQTYTSLRIVGLLRSNEIADRPTVAVRVNGDTGSNYDSHDLQSVGTAPAAGEIYGLNLGSAGNAPGANAPAGVFGLLEIDIHNYTLAINKILAARTEVKWGTTAGKMRTALNAVYWRSNAAITRVQIFSNAGSYIAPSKLTLYGIA
jgi:hypothetical protein